MSIVRISGTMDLYNMPELKEEFERLLTAGRVRVVLNLSEVESIDSSGIGAMIAFLQQLRRQEGHLVLSAVSQPCRYVLNLTRLSAFFDLVDDDTEAQAAVVQS
ncbi:MAG: STAS domain-containing protein [Spirochaetales bacterium]|nr:STAS domain-containing protein [Spirochaetales bacterium]